MRRLLPLLVCAAFACKRGGDDAAKARIFSPEPPPNVSPESKEQLDAKALEGDPKLAERVLHMPQREIAQRLGPHGQDILSVDAHLALDPRAPRRQQAHQSA